MEGVRRLVWAATVAVVVGGATGALGQCRTEDRARAVRLAREAKEAMEAKRLDEALVALRAAYVLCPEARLRHAMGRVQEEAGAVEEAARSFRACEAESKGDELGADCRRRAEALEAKLRAARTAPAALPEPVAKTQPPPAVGTPPREKPPAPPREKPPASVPKPPVRPARDTTWNWVGIGASVAAIGAGVGFLAMYGKDRSDARGAEYYPDGSLKREADRVSPTNAVVGGVCAGIGVAGLVTSLLTWPDGQAAVAAGPTESGGVVGFVARW